MRKRWVIPENLGWILVCFWLFGWLPVYLLVYAVAVPGGLSGTDGTVSPIFFGTWFGVPILLALVVTSPRAARWLWAQRPRRVYESSADIRKVYRR